MKRRDGARTPRLAAPLASLILPSCYEFRLFSPSLNPIVSYLPLWRRLTPSLTHWQLSSPLLNISAPPLRLSQPPPPTPAATAAAAGDQPLGCQMMLRVALPPASLPLQSHPITRAHTQHTQTPSLSLFQFLPVINCRRSRLPLLFRLPSSLDLLLSDRLSCPLHVPPFPSVSRLVRSAFCSFNNRVKKRRRRV